MNLLSKMVRSLCVKMAEKLPKRVIGRNESDLYLERCYVLGKAPPYPQTYTKWPHEILGFLPTVYLHHFLRSDEDHELHNHPWNGYSLILAGGYAEERRFTSDEYKKAVLIGKWLLDSRTLSNSKKMDVFDSFFLENERVKYVVLARDFKPGSINLLGKDTFHRVDLLEDDCWTLFMVGAKQQTWGFWNRFSGEFLHWREHLAKAVARRKEQVQA